MRLYGIYGGSVTLTVTVAFFPLPSGAAAVIFAVPSELAVMRAATP